MRIPAAISAQEASECPAGTEEGSIMGTIGIGVSIWIGIVFLSLIHIYTPGKIQFGSGWWFNDHKDGMNDQMRALAANGVLAKFVGMLTDSRSFLSFPRHEYFRRLLCQLLGEYVENGEYPNDVEFLGQIVEDICYNNAKSFFNLDK